MNSLTFNFCFICVACDKPHGNPWNKTMRKKKKCTMCSLRCCNPPTWLIFKHQARSLKYLPLNCICSISQSHIRVKVKPAYVKVLYWASNAMLGFRFRLPQIPKYLRLKAVAVVWKWNPFFWHVTLRKIPNVLHFCPMPCFMYKNPLNLWHMSNFGVLNSPVTRKLFVR